MMSAVTAQSRGLRLIEALPCVQLGNLPTPLEQAPRLAAALGGPTPLYVKRDDLTGLATGGNKVRKLNYMIGDALAKECDVVVTAAGIQSNRARMTAAACRRVGLDCVLLLGGDYGENRPVGNLMLDAIFGAEVRFRNAYDAYSNDARAEAEAVADELRRQGRRPYLTEVGGTPEPESDVGYFMGALELAEQCRALNFEPGTVLLPCGSGCQQAGVVMGLRSAGLSTRVVGVSTDPGAAERAERVMRRARALAEFLDLDYRPLDDDIIVDDRFSAPGHGFPDQAGVAAVRLAARTEGLLIDPTYVGKVVAAIPHLVQTGVVDAKRPAVLWNTGGTMWVFMYQDAFTRFPDPSGAPDRI
jgi:L-cysteate sulfo-lyase